MLLISIMHRIFSKLSRIITANSKQTISSLNKQSNLTVIPSGLLKWGSLRFVRNSRFATGFTPLQPKPLDSIMEIERGKHKSPEEIASIWDDVIEDIVEHQQQFAYASKFHMLKHWWPLSLGKGPHRRNHERKALPFASAKSSRLPPHMIFTELEDYKARGTQASPYFIVTFYTEIEDSKDLVFIRGDIVFASKLTDSEAKWLVETAQSFHLNDVRYKLVERFNKETHEFEFKDVLKVLEMADL